LVREQIRIAAGGKLTLKQEDVRFNGAAIEVRINAEHPETFAPSPGKITEYHAPGGPGVRVDSALYSGYKVPSHYDSLVSKLIVHGKTRNECLMRLRRALEEYVIVGINTTIPLHQRLIADPDFITGDYTIHWLEQFMERTAVGKDGGDT
jgi:acetyl-CoA carboxylase, biotin carboxylase subunit